VIGCAGWNIASASSAIERVFRVRGVHRGLPKVGDRANGLRTDAFGAALSTVAYGRACERAMGETRDRASKAVRVQK
jgi:hypothetical protein